MMRSVAVPAHAIGTVVKRRVRERLQASQLVVERQEPFASIFGGQLIDRSVHEKDVSRLEVLRQRIDWDDLARSDDRGPVLGDTVKV
jgi:hypothetical protein